MYLKDMKPGMIVAYELEYGKVRRARIDKLEKYGRTIEAVHLSYGRKFEQEETVSSWVASYKLLAPWDDYRAEQKKAKSMRDLCSDLSERAGEALEMLELDCWVREGELHVRGDIRKIEELVMYLEAIDLGKGREEDELTGLLGE